MTLKGFESAFDEEEKIRPLPGTMAHLMWVEEKKKREAEAKKPVDNSLLIDDSTIAEMITVADKAIDTKKATVAKIAIVDTVAEKATVAEPAIDDGYVKTNNWMKLDLDIVRVMPRLSGAEFKIYIYFLTLSYGAFPDPKNICSVSLSTIAEVLDLESTAPVSRCVKSLMQQGFLKRQFKGEAKKDLSIYRVFLPSEIPNIGGKTKIELLRR